MSRARDSLAPRRRREVGMRYFSARSIAVVAVLTFAPLAMPQAAETQAKFNAHDLSGVWQFAPGGGGQGPGGNFPPLTPWGRARYDANKQGYAPKAAPGGNEQILKRDPMAVRRTFF